MNIHVCYRRNGTSYTSIILVCEIQINSRGILYLVKLTANCTCFKVSFKVAQNSFQHSDFDGSL